ncbi:MAG: hypothetical protein AVDCRST_MAG18-1458 [uncultured Thermomicrobiales bacterium]|uniref:ADP-dependent (S)-NAD(P)H-hydrate dehydratase n=1 Tax=uncultured Thermomicrobiales bacterium TaxID=1645740 RepID=A0A6J4V196_9BACT|nr:MAG: hypothetical protein AVDCRST_MAG18-1458 [uncultured Thermomicrobiales bacterium]
MKNDDWPEELWIVRHAESVGNAARYAALAAGGLTIALPARDPDVPLSERGVEQARALGRWFGGSLSPAPPTAVLTSPYRRTRETTAYLAAAAGWPIFGALETGAPIAGSPAEADGAGDGASIPLIVDERLREKDAGRLEGLTRAGIIERYPAEATAYDHLGKFYYRPPGGESWCDVVLRLRSLVDALRAEHGGGRVLIVTHQVIVVCLRYVLEGLDEASVLDLERPGEVANASVTSYRREGDRLALVSFNIVAPLEAEGAPITAEPSASYPPTPAAEQAATDRGTGVAEEGDHPPGQADVAATAPPERGTTAHSGDSDRESPGDEPPARSGHAAPCVITRRLLARWPLPAADTGDDKEARGRVLIVGGDARVPGGALLAGTAALRAGAGKLQLAVAEAVALAVAVAIPEALVAPLPASPSGAPDPERATALEAYCRAARAIVIGPGLVEPPAAGALVERVVGWMEGGNLVVDATALAGVTEGLGRRLGGRLILTPNAGEMVELLGWSPERVAEDADRAAQTAAEQFGAIVALKGRETRIAEPGGGIYRNRAGNVGLAVSGSGDLLAGIVGGLLARGADPLLATVWAVHLHGLAADILARTVGPLGFLPRELPRLLPGLLATLARPGPRRQ